MKVGNTGDTGEREEEEAAKAVPTTGIIATGTAINGNPVAGFTAYGLNMKNTYLMRRQFVYQISNQAHRSSIIVIFQII
jgi:hypothetical protein